MTTSQHPSEPVTLDNCASEPIHIPGATQPHGVLFSCRAEDLGVLQVSANVADYFEGASPADVLGKPVTECFDPPSRAVLTALATSPDLPHENPFRLQGNDARIFDATAHRSGERLVLEVEPSERTHSSQVGSFDPRLRPLIVRLNAAQTTKELAQLAAESVRHLTGFDRVMVYRFDAEWNGEVVAEAKLASLSPFLGLRYPASDIPSQARRLYTVNRLRFIADVAYQPVPLTPAFDPEHATPLDMSHSILRSVSPIHIQYLKNMGVSASMSVSLIVDGKLAGLIACHHYAGPRRVSSPIRDTASYLGEVLSWQLNLLERRDRADRTRETQVHEAEVIRHVAVTPELLDGLDTPALLQLAEATGAAVVLEEGLRKLGAAPSSAEIRSIVAWLRARGAQVYATDHLAHEMPEAASIESAAGLIAVAISPEVGEYLLWFRPAITRVIHWGGNPYDKDEKDGPDRLSPRGSFELYKETVQGRSEPWMPWQVEAASNLRKVLLGGVRRRAVELRSLNRRLLDADRSKDLFLATVSHELRTPLNAIHGWASLLQTGVVSGDKLPHAIDVIARNAQAQAKLIDDLIDLSKVVGGRLSLDVEEVNLAAVIDAALASLSLAMESKSIQLVRALEPDAGTVRGDANRLRQIVVNLLTNATKFTEKAGRIEVRLRRIESDIELSVHDDGQGIAPEFVERVFDPFRQEDAETTRKIGGLGLGLAIAKKLVELHGGRIWVESDGKGRGARFFVRLPVSPVVRESRPEIELPTRPTAHLAAAILLVDDDDDGRELLTNTLEMVGARVTAVSNAKDALDLLERTPFDLIVSDVGMPELDGLAFLRILRTRDASAGGHIPAVALTAYARASDRVAALDAGFQAHVAKPVDFAELIATLQSVLRRIG